MIRYDLIIIGVATAIALVCNFILLVPHPLVPFSGDTKQQEITKPAPLVDKSGVLTQVGWARHPYPTFHPDNLPKFSQLVSQLNQYRLKEWDNYILWNENFAFSIIISDIGYIAKISVNFVDFKTRKFLSNGYTVPTAELNMSPNVNKVGTQIDLLSKQYGFKAEVSVAEDLSRTIEIASPNFTAKFTLRPASEQEYLTVVAPIGGTNFYYNVKLYNSVPEGRVQIENDPAVTITRDTYSFFEWSRGMYDYRSNWAFVGTTTMIDGKRRLSLNFGTGLGDQTRASENAIILGYKIIKLGYVDIAYDENSLMNPWILTTKEGMRLVFAPFVDYQTESSKTFLLLSTRSQQIFGKFVGSIEIDGEEISMEGVTGFAEVHYNSW